MSHDKYYSLLSYLSTRSTSLISSWDSKNGWPLEQDVYISQRFIIEFPKQTSQHQQALTRFRRKQFFTAKLTNEKEHFTSNFTYDKWRFDVKSALIVRDDIIHLTVSWGAIYNSLW